MNFRIKLHLQGQSHPHSFPGRFTQLWVTAGICASSWRCSGSCCSLTLFQMFSRLHTWWAHGWCFPSAAEQVCGPRGHLSAERAVSTACLSKRSEFLSIYGTAGGCTAAGLCVLGAVTAESQARGQNSDGVLSVKYSRVIFG